ncbi:hypothetical protein [Bauldia sp.]|uniref:hypothetical protein n=1 Tax=Bauldia sp. TaxID=2575872 RepID=UPI003BAB80FD
MRCASIVTVGLLSGMAAIMSFAAATAQEPAPDLVGVWTGKVEAGVSHGIQGHEPTVHEPTFGNYDLTFTLTIEEQEGRAITGVWSSPDHAEAIFGVVRRDNDNLIMVDEDSHFDGILLSPTSMELCLAETHGEAMGTWCLLMEKQPD